MVCLICKKKFSREIAAISRKNSSIYICPDCGVQEALNDIPESAMSKERKQEIFDIASKINKKHYKERLGK